jgi:CubicO group peptidase (beta-lactamase class C family)
VEEAVKNKFNRIDDYKPLSVNYKLDFEPGTKFDYNNLGYHLLGAIIEKVSGMSYYNYINENLFKPANMVNAGFPVSNSDPYLMSIGYEKVLENGRLIIKDNTDRVNIKGSPAGLGYATVKDMFQFSRALKQNILITEQTKQLIFSPKEELNARRYGYGFQIRTIGDKKIVLHTGGI